MDSDERLEHGRMAWAWASGSFDVDAGFQGRARVEALNDVIWASARMLLAMGAKPHGFTQKEIDAIEAQRERHPGDSWESLMALYREVADATG